METIDRLITDVQNYFKEKLLSGDYTILETSEHRSEIMIDLIRRFSIWHSNGIKYFGLCPNGGNYFMEIPDLREDEKETAWPVYSQKLSVFNLKNNEEKRLKEIKRLTALLEELKSQTSNQSNDNQ